MSGLFRFVVDRSHRTTLQLTSGNLLPLEVYYKGLVGVQSCFCSWIFLSSSMLQPLPYCTYVLFSEKDAMLYIGYSSNLQQRIIDHNRGHTKSTANRRPLKLIFCEFYLFEKDARKREKYFKTTAGKKALRFMLRTTLIALGHAGKLRYEFEEELW